MYKKLGWLLAAAASISINAFGSDEAQTNDEESSEVVLNLKEITEDNNSSDSE